jgi:hypothetical protein
MASLFGTMTPFTREQLQALYPSRDAYLRAYGAAVDRAVEGGYVLRRDAAADIERAAAAQAAELFPG